MGRMQGAWLRGRMGAVVGLLLTSPLWLSAQTVPHNILFILADDIGMDALQLFNTNHVGATFAATPTIDALGQQGVLFRNAYGYPSCSPTRSCLLTGRYGFRTGIGAAIGYLHDPVLSPREFTLPKALDANPQLGFHHAHIGKWHLSEGDADPNTTGGWSHFSGFLGGEEAPYTDWIKVVDGVASAATNYATSDQVDDALGWMAAQGTNRWFLWFAPKSAHAPLHKPPNALHSYDSLPAEIGTNDPMPYYQAMIEALDTELGRLLAQVTLSNTLVVFMADNGTPTETIQSPYASYQCKGTLFEGGQRVPLLMAGAGVIGSNRSADAVVHAVDVPATLLDMAGVNLAATLPTNLVFDGRSFAAVVRDQSWNPTEPTILSENFGTIVPEALWGVSVRGARYKVAQLDGGQQAFFDLQTDPYEYTNLLGAPISSTNLTPAQLLAYAGLTNRLAGWHNIPAPPLVSMPATTTNTPQFAVTEQLGIAYALERTRNLQTQPWTVVTNYVREVATDAPTIRLSDPTPVAPPVFYRVSATGR